MGSAIAYISTHLKEFEIRFQCFGEELDPDTLRDTILEIARAKDPEATVRPRLSTSLTGDDEATEGDQTLGFCVTLAHPLPVDVVISMHESIAYELRRKFSMCFQRI